MENPTIFVYCRNAETINLQLIDPTTNHGKDLTGTTVTFKVMDDLNPAAGDAYITSDTATLVSAGADGEFTVTFAATDFTSVADYWYGVFVDGVLMVQGKFVVRDSIIIPT